MRKERGKSMSRLKGKRVRIGKYTIPALLLISLAIGTVAAVAYVILTYTMTATVVANPKVSFIKWSNGTKANTFAYSVNIFPSIKTVDENTTYGIWNSDSAIHSTGLRVSAITNQAANIGSFLVKVSNATTVWSITTVGSSFTTVALSPGKYTIWIEVTGAAGATPGASSVFTVDMKVENP